MFDNIIRKHLMAFPLCLVLIAGAVYPIAGIAAYSEESALIPSDVNGGASVGQAVAVQGEIAVIGAPGADQARGAVFVFKREQSGEWHQVARLSASDATGPDFFGAAVAIRHGLIAVGAPGRDGEQGKDSGGVYLFFEPVGGWRDGSEDAIIEPAETEGAQGFGKAVIMGDAFLAVGAPGKEGGTQTGAVYIFARSGNSWKQVSRLTASDGGTGDLFGFALDERNGWLAVGAYGREPGAVYLFRRSASGWGEVSEERILEARDGSSGDQFGYAVAMTKEWVVVGADRDDDKGNDAGAIHLFSIDGMGYAKIAPEDGHPDQGFGYALDAVDERIAVGALLDDTQGLNAAGAVYLYQLSGAEWVMEKKIHPEGMGAENRFGSAVVLTTDYLLAGAFGEGVAGVSGVGSAHLFVQQEAGNDSPQANDDNFVLSAGEKLVHPVGKLLANDEDANGDTLQLARLAGRSAKGGWVMEENGVFTYTPPEGYNGADSFGYVISDGKGGLGYGTVHLTIRAGGGGGGGGSWGPWPLFLMGLWWALLRHRAPGSRLRP